MVRQRILMVKCLHPAHPQSSSQVSHGIAERFSLINFRKPSDSPEGLIHHILIFIFAGSLFILFSTTRDPRSMNQLHLGRKKTAH